MNEREISIDSPMCNGLLNEFGFFRASTVPKAEKKDIASYNIQNRIQEVFHKNRGELHQILKGGKEIPEGFEEFVHSDLCYEFCETILDYCKYLLKLDKKKKELEEDARKRRIPAPKILKSETDKL